MPLIARLEGVTLSGTAQVLHSQELGGVFIEGVFMKNASGANALTDLKAFERPYVGGPRAQVGSTVASVAAGAAARVDVGKAVEVLEVEATQGAGGNGVDLAVTSRLADE